MKKATFNKIKQLLIASAVVTTALGGYAAYDQLPKQYNRVLYVGEFDSKSVDRVLSRIIKAEEKSGRILLEITSPGGEVMSGDAVVVEVNVSGRVDTYIPSFAASMGAETFMQGKHRYMEEHAEVLFHGVHAGGITEPMFEALISFISSGDAKRYVAEEDVSSLVRKEIEAKYVDVPPSTLSRIARLESELGFDELLKALKEIHKELHKINERSLDRWNSFIEKSNGKWTRELIKEKIYGNYKKDMIFSGSQMFEMGMIDGLGRPQKG